MSEPFTIVFSVYPGITQLDFTGPYEVLSRLPGAECIVASTQGCCRLLAYMELR